MNAPIVHVVDDDEAMRVALSRLLTAEGHTVKTYASAGDFLLNPPAPGPGCMVLDLSMPGPSGLDLQRALERHPVSLPIVFLSGHGDIETSVRAMKAGAIDFLTKPVAPESLLQSVAVALKRAQSACSENGITGAVKARFATLSERERQVFEQVVAGKLNKQIGEKLGISERTVKMHRAHLMAKMRATSLAQLLHLAEMLRRAGTMPEPFALAH